MKVHELKSWPVFFNPMNDGQKLFDIRKDDRNYEVGDVLIQREWKPGPNTHIGYTGRELRVIVIYTLRSTDEGVAGHIPDGYVCMGVYRVGAGPVLTRTMARLGMAEQLLRRAVEICHSDEQGWGSMGEWAGDVETHFDTFGEPLEEKDEKNDPD